ncbi:hypothetical protein F4780DRAFT_778301 [Xylariomycetidae sp. FL0641]|nr:hypothetical protein F4780DRAFT_778301 [Xylariomycetidae sp. FL0641]
MASTTAREDHQAPSEEKLHATDSKDSRTSRLLHRRSRPMRQQQPREPSLSSLDRVYETRSGPLEDATKPPAARTQASMNLDRKHPIGNTYGVTELRDGWFDAVFFPPDETDPEELARQAESTLPFAFRKKDPLSLHNFLPKQWHDIQGVVRRVTTTRSGIKLLKTFLGFFIAYILCLIPSVRERLGRYSYVMVISAIINHPGRTLGAQVDGAFFTILGTATGLGWGAFGLWVSHATAPARFGYGGILAAFLFSYIFVMACLRSYYIRTYQFVICAGISVSYTCLADVAANHVSWPKLFSYGIPWLLGQAICLLVAFTVAPDAGARPLAVALHQTFAIMLDGIRSTAPDSRTRRRRLTQAFVGMSQTYRDLVIDFSITLFHPKDVWALRNLIQGVIRTLLSLRTDTRLFDPAYLEESTAAHSPGEEFIIEVEKREAVTQDETEMLKFVISNLAEPAERLLQSMAFGLKSCDATLMEMCGHRKYLGPPSEVSNDVLGALVKLRKRIIEFSQGQDSVLASDRLPPTYADYPEVVEVFAFCRPVQQAASAVEALLVKVNHMQQRRPRYPKFHLPAYPFWKALHRSNAQVRHDRGGVTAGKYYAFLLPSCTNSFLLGSYFRSFSDIAESIQEIKSRDFQPVSRKTEMSSKGQNPPLPTMEAKELDGNANAGTSTLSRLKHNIWAVLHHGQGFETRFGLKTALVMSLLSVPAWLSGSDGWWDKYEIWWAVVMAWLIMGPRTGGNVQDLFTRVLCGILGSVWGGLAYGARNGNPYVVAVFALIFMLPMLYRFTQSSHPRSGIVGCMAFTIVSLSEVTAEDSSATTVAWTRGAAIAVGVTASILVNWILWPFIARHDLRKATASMMFYCSIVARYVYYEAGHEPTKKDIEASEVLEGRLREGFVRLRQLLGLTRHEIRLRAPFDPLPYSALIDSCEHFFDYLVTVRQSSLFYHPHFIRDNADAAADLLGHRRDAIATILTNLYILSGALRAGRKVPKYLPSAAASRKALLDRMKEIEARLATSESLSAEEKTEEKKWVQIYSYSYNESLTGCVRQLGELEKFTKAIVGEQGLDCGLTDELTE